MIRIGIIGAGPNGTGHAHYFHQSPRSRVVAVADPHLERAAALAAGVGAKPVADFRAFLGDVDAVVISSPNYLHRNQAETCAQAGLHIWCEKPLGLSLEDAQSIASAIHAAGVQSTVGFTVRFSTEIQTMRRYLRMGQIGELVSLTSRRLHWVDPYQSTSWRQDPALCGGLLFELTIHELEWMMALGGPVTSVFARTWAANPTNPRSNDYLWIMLNFAEGAVGMHEGCWLSANPQFFRAVQGSFGGLSTNEWGNVLYYARVGQEREEAQLEPAFDLRANFLDTIEGRAEAVSDVNWGLQVMAVAETVLQSAFTRHVQPVEL